MAIWPDTDKRFKPDVPYIPVWLENVGRSEADSGSSQRRDNWNRLRFAVQNMRFSHRDAIYTLRTFYRLNRVVTFTFFDFDTDQTSAVVTLGTGNGVNRDFTIPAKATSGWTIYLNGVSTVAYGILTGAGAQGEDVLRMNVAPANGVVVTALWTGRMRYTCEFTGPPTHAVDDNGKRSIAFSIQEAW